MLGITGFSLAIGAGHVFTLRDHNCGDFSDEFDWSSLPLAYLKSIGAGADGLAVRAHLLSKEQNDAG